MRRRHHLGEEDKIKFGEVMVRFLGCTMGVCTCLMQSSGMWEC